MSTAPRQEQDSRVASGFALRARLAQLAYRAARGKRRAADVARFLVDVDASASALAGEIESGTYRPGVGKAFRIEDPKPRVIYALPFRDRVAQHLLIDETLPLIERSLAPQTYACRAGKGTHACLLRAVELTRAKAFVLRIDISRFFPSIDLSLMRATLDRSTPTPWRWLRDRFLDAPCVVEQVGGFVRDDGRRRGLPIGSLTSQIWANAYLSPIDHCIGSFLHLGTFVRYCDDILVFDDDRARLGDVLATLAGRAERLRLQLHPTKTRLHRTSDPVSFLGFVIRRRGDGVSVRLRHDNVLRMRRRMQTLRALFAAGAIEPEDLRSHVTAWLAHARHGHTRALVETELQRLAFVCARDVSRAQ